MSERHIAEDRLRAYVESLKQEAASARASRDALAVALRWMEQFHAQPGEGANERFERIGEIFYRATGYLRPGKDCRIHSMEEREQAWDQWIAENLASARRALAQHANGTETVAASSLTIPRDTLEAAASALEENAWLDGLCMDPQADEDARVIRAFLAQHATEQAGMSKSDEGGDTSDGGQKNG